MFEENFVTYCLFFLINTNYQNRVVAVKALDCGKYYYSFLKVSRKVLRSECTMNAVCRIEEHLRSPGLLKLLEFYNFRILNVYTFIYCKYLCLYCHVKKIFLAENSRGK